MKLKWTKKEVWFKNLTMALSVRYSGLNSKGKRAMTDELRNQPDIIEEQPSFEFEDIYEKNNSNNSRVVKR